MNRFTNLDICDLYMDGDGRGSYYAVADEQLIDWIETLRKAKGYEDFIASNNYENDIYYDFYVIFDFDKKEIKLNGIAKETEKDDFAEYECELTSEEKEYIMWLIIYEMSKEM